MIQFNLETTEASSVASPFAVSVIGIGGSGTNVIDKIALESMPGADLVSLNCDARALSTSMADTKVQLGKSLTQGLGCGGDPELGAEAALASAAEIRDLLAGRNMVFLCVGLGGGTGSGAAPVVARMAREAGAFVVVFATLPFAFEGRRRSNQASVALQDLRKYANALVTFENDRMGELVVPKKGVQEAFELADKIIGQSVRAVTSLVTQPGLIHIGMDDLVTALRNTDSRCLFGHGQAKGENRAVEALGIALKSPLLDRGQMLSGARNVLVHICGGTTLTLFEIETLMRELGKQVHEDAQILFGAATDSRLAESLSVTILTSLSKPVPAVEAVAAPAAAAPVTAAPAPAVSAAPAPAPGETPGSAVEGEAETDPVPETEVPPPAASASPAHPEGEPDALPMECPAPALAEETELFPEIMMPAEPMLIDIPAVKPAAGKPPVRPLPAPPQVEEPLTTVSEYDAEEVFEVDETGRESEPDLTNLTVPAPVSEPAQIHAATDLPAAEPEGFMEGGIEDIEEDGEWEEFLPPVATAPVADPVPERVLRIERQPEPPSAKPAPARNGTAPATKRFVLSDIIKPKAAPVPQEPIMEDPAPHEVREAPLRPAPSPAPVSRRTPDFDRVAPIRPIPAGRSPSPLANPGGASPFQPSKPAARPVPTQQQTFDERLQPASSGGRFDRSKPTVEEGEDLDVPTFLRRKR